MLVQNSTCVMCQGVEDTVFSREFVVAVPVEVLVYGWVSCTQMLSNVLSGLWETKVSRNGMDPSLLGTSVVNCVWGSMKLIWYRTCWLCSACWTTSVISIPKPKPEGTGGSPDGLGVKSLP